MVKLYEYESIEKYREQQIEWAIPTRYGIWVEEEDIKFLADYLQQNFDISQFKMGICHGSKLGIENAWFEKYLGIDVWGTDLGDRAHDPRYKEQSPYHDIIDPHKNIQWDFHDVKDEWIDSVDVIYSNAMDHSRDPRFCLEQWMRCIKKTGACILEWTPWHSEKHANIGNPFGASLEEYQELAESCGFEVKDVLTKEFGPKHQFGKKGKKNFVIIVHSQG